MRPAAALLILCLCGLASAASPVGGTRLTVLFPATPGLDYNRLGQPSLSVQTPWGSQTALLRGVTGAFDPQHYWATLLPVSLNLTVPKGAPARFPVKLSAVLYLCDEQRGICTVQRPSLSGTVQTGRSQSLTLPAPGLLR